MNLTKTTKLAMIVGLALCLGPRAAWADAAGDLSAGRAALAGGDAAKALPLLESAAQALPQSVEAQLELARGYLAAGQLDKALAQFRAVAKLSPEHAEAKRMIDALSGQQKTFEQKLALARTMADLTLYQPAAAMLSELANGPYEPAQRLAARMALAEARLWQSYTTDPLAEVTRALNEAKGSPSEPVARVMVAMSLVTITTGPNLARAAELVKGAEVQGAWKQRAELVGLLMDIGENMKPDTPGKLATALTAIRGGGYRDELVNRLMIEMALQARLRAERGATDAALAVLAGFLTTEPPADANLDDEFMKARPKGFSQIILMENWDHQGQIIQALMLIGQKEIEAKGADAKLEAFRLAGEYLQACPQRRFREVGDWTLKVIEGLANLSRPAADRKKGQPLSVADALQWKLIWGLFSQAKPGAVELSCPLVNEDQRGRLVNAVIGQMERYKAAKEPELALRLFLNRLAIGAELEQGKGPWILTMFETSAGPAERRLSEYLAAGFAALGAEEFAKAAASAQPDANAKLNDSDASAIDFYSQLVARYGSDASATAIPAANGIIDRYAAADHWPAAAEATGLLYRQVTGDAGAWALARLKVRQATWLEDRQLAAQRKLGDKLDALAVEALAGAAGLVKANPSDANKSAAAELAMPLVVRYSQLDRPDLAEAVVAALAPPPAADAAASPLADWALLTRANLLDKQAAALLARAAKEFDGPGKLVLLEPHAAELKLLGQLIDGFPKSPRVPAALAGVTRISAAYQGHKAFDVAAAVLADFVKAHAKLDARLIQRLQYARVAVLSAKAAAAFAERPDKLGPKPPEKLSDEYAAVTDELAAFLKANPTGDYSPAAENELFAVARVYGQQGAWGVARDVLKRFAAAVPDFRSPEHLRLMEAATYLGELDRGHGLELMNPPPAPQPISGSPGRWIFADGKWVAVRGDRASGAMDDFEARDGWDLSDGDWKDGAKKSPPSGPAALSGVGSFGGFGGLGGGGARGGRAGAPRGEALAASPGEKPASGAPNLGLDVSSDEPTLTITSGGIVVQNAEKKMEDVHDIPGQSLAMIRQAEQQQSRRIAQMNPPASARQPMAQQQGGPQAFEAIVLPAGPVLSEAEMKRQDAAADAAYAILVALVKDGQKAPADTVGPSARGQVLWLIGFFEGQLRANRAVAIIEQYLKDQPTDFARVELAYQAIGDRLVWAGQRQPKDKIDQAWVDARHELYEQARASIAAFIKEFSGPAKTQAGKDSVWVSRARLQVVTSFEQEADRVAAVSAARAGGLLARSADELLALLDSEPDHPDLGGFPGRLWSIAERLIAIGQRDQAIYVLGRLPNRFPTDGLAAQAVLRIAQLYAGDLSAPLRAVETYQEYLALAGDNDSIRSQIFTIAQQLESKQRYLEALHVFGVYVDCFPGDAQAGAALLSIGRIHQANGAWNDALKAYQRILEEYAASPLVPQVKLATAECQIQLSQWKLAKKIYTEFAEQYAGDPQAQLAKDRIEILKNLDRYQMLLADKQITRNKDDAQFQIGKIVLDRMNNRVKAIEEFRKVTVNFPKSELAASAQFEIGKVLLDMERLDEARAELMRVPTEYPTSPLADNALFLVGQSYERQAERLAGVTLEKARAVAFEAGQRGAYQEFQKQQADINKGLTEQRKALKAAAAKQPSAANSAELEMNEAYSQFRYNFDNSGTSTLARNAERAAETESSLELANRQDRINEAYRNAVAAYARAAREYPLGTTTGNSLLRMAQVYEVNLKDRAKAMETYQQIVKFFPGTPVAESAAWKVAKFYEQQGNYDQAVTAYRDFIRAYPTSGQVADAQFAMAEALEQQGRWVEAMDAYQTFRDKFTTNPKAAAASEQIQWIKAYRK